MRSSWIKNLYQKEIFVQSSSLQQSLKLVGIETRKLEKKSLLECIKRTEEAVNTILETEKDKTEFLKGTQNLKALFKAILPDSEARKYAKLVFVCSILSAKIREVTIKFIDNKEIKELAEQVEELLNESITLKSYAIKAGEKLDLSKIDFEELQRRILKGKKLALLEKLKATISSKLSMMLKLNDMRKHFQEKFEQIIDEYNAGKLTMEQMYI